jgi:adenylate cyclase
MYEKAIELDPAYGTAHALLAYALSLEWFRDMTGSDVLLDRALELAKKAVQLDDMNTDCINVLAWIYLNRCVFDLAEQNYQRALELNPNNPLNVAAMGFWLTFVGRPEEAVGWFKQAKLVDPHFNPAWLPHMLGVAYFAACAYDEAIGAFGRSRTNPFWVRAYLAACHALTNKLEIARELSLDVLRLVPQFSARRLVAKEPYKHSSDRERLLEGLRKAGLPE